MRIENILLLITNIFVCISVHATEKNLIIVNDPILQRATTNEAGLGLTEERYLGDAIAKTLYQEPKYLHDPILQEYIETIGTKLLIAARKRNIITEAMRNTLAWRWIIFKDSEVNAFALPGGYIGINLGLIVEAQSSSEVAAVMAHELIHVSQRHIARHIEAQKKQAPAWMASILLGALAAQSNPQLGSAVLATGQGLGIQSQLNFSRDMEREADRLAIELMREAGFQAYAAKSFFETLQRVHRLNDEGDYPYLRTHPLNQTRIADIQDRLTTEEQKKPLEKDLEHELIVARIQVLLYKNKQNNPHDQLLSRLSKEKHQKARALYESAIYLGQSGQYTETMQKVVALQGLLTENAKAWRLSQLLIIELALQQKKPSLALEKLNTLLEQADSPGRPEALLIVVIRQKLGGIKTSDFVILERIIAKNPLDIQALQALADLHLLTQNSLRSLELQADARAAMLDYQGAIDRLRAAQAHPLAGQASAKHRNQIAIIDAKRMRYEALQKIQKGYVKLL
jgi:predicted Zn-dependent protease